MDLSRVANWRKSLRSQGQGACVEVGTLPCVVAVRDSKNPDGPKLAVSAGAWEAFVRAVR